MRDENIAPGYVPLPCKIKYSVITDVLPRITVNGKPIEEML